MRNDEADEALVGSCTGFSYVSNGPAAEPGCKRSREGTVWF